MKSVVSKKMFQPFINFDMIDSQVIEFGTSYACFFQRLEAPTIVLYTVIFLSTVAWNKLHPEINDFLSYGLKLTTIANLKHKKSTVYNYILTIQN
jgi:hypothetical protein